MNFLILLLLALGLRVSAFNYPFIGEQNSNEVEVVNYNDMGGGTCPKIKQPLCATNGQEYLYFDNKCLLEVRNFEQLLQGLQEYFECPLSYCSPQCAPCGLIHEPVCAIDVLTGQMENYPNPCEVERKICFTQRDHRIISSGQCPLTPVQPSECPQFCTLEYNPVCAQFNTEFKQFPNQCQLHKERCETKADWKIVAPNKCAPVIGGAINLATQSSECPEFCTLEYRPICARFMTLEKEFSNECELKTTICQTKQKWDIIRHGPCQESQENTAFDVGSSKCPQFCILEYSPICAKFENQLREFANKCELETTICTTQQDWQIIQNGPCNSSPQFFTNKAVVRPAKTKCAQFCTLEYSPICAKFNNDVREFRNKCELESTICETDQEWQIIKHGSCPSSDNNNNKAVAFSQKPKCPQACTLEYSPICAKFNNELREFGNKCNFEAIKCETEQEWQFVQNGPCPSSDNKLLNKAVAFSQKPKCPEICTVEYSPICAKLNNELKEFSNNCDLQRTNCQSKEKWVVVHEGTCDSNKKSKCPKFCTLDYSPICAGLNNELREFANKCELESIICETNQKWKIVKQGPCFVDTSAEESECPQFCTDDYRPVCAEFNGQQREFTNKCELLKEICETNTKWAVVKLGTCSKPWSACPKFCTREFDPVCGKLNNELREFSNKCVLESFNCESEEKWEIVNLGTCPKGTQAECPKFCTREYNPVCAEFENELREFPNKCELQRENCETDKGWTVIKQGSCAKHSPKLLRISSPCPKSCTREFDPVCGKLNNELREFSNKCVFENFNCETDKKWEIVNFGTCPNKGVPQAECPKFCTREYNPVCAEFENELREFPNKCELQRENCETDKGWEIIKLGTCSSDSNCPKFCTREYNPVCARMDKELREFPNKCELLRTSCELKKNWEVVHFGACLTNSHNLPAAQDSLWPAPKCPQICTAEYRPVCAEFNAQLKEFGNACELQRTICETKEDWLVVNEGPCAKKSQSKLACPKFCTKEFRPVCARFNGKLREFPNKCEFQRSVCETNIDWKLVNLGPCLIKTFKSDNIELQPICATNGQIKKIFNSASELQGEISKTGTAWSLLHNDDCPTSPTSCEKEDLDPICAISDLTLKTFNNICQLSEEIRNTGNNWSILHKGICSTSPTATTTTEASSSSTPKPRPTTKTPAVKIANKALPSTNDRSTKNPTTVKTTRTTTPRTTAKPKSKTTEKIISTLKTTTTKPKTTSSTTRRTTFKPKTTTTLKTTTKKPATMKTTTTFKASSTTPLTTAKPKGSTTKKSSIAVEIKSLKPANSLKATVKPNTTTLKTITATTTTQKTTTAASSKYSSTGSTTTHDQYPDDYSTEEDSAELDDTSKGYYEDQVSCCDCGSQEEDGFYSSENMNDEIYSSWEEVEDDEDEEDNAYAYEIPSRAYTIDDNTYTYKHNESNSTYTFIYGKDSTNSYEGYSEENDASERSSEESVIEEGIYANVENTGDAKSEKKSFESSKGLLKDKLIQTLSRSAEKDSKESHKTKETKPPTKDHKLGNIKQKAESKVQTFSANQEDLKLSDSSSEGNNLVKSIQDRIWEVFGSQKHDERLEETQNKRRILKTKQHHQIKPNEKPAKINLKADSSKHVQAAKGNFQKYYENPLRTYHDNDDSVEGVSTQPPVYTQQVTHSYEPLSIHDNEPKFGVYNDEAYGLRETSEAEWSTQRQTEEPQYNEHNMGNNYNEIDANNKFNSFNTAATYQSDKTSQQEQQIPEYSTNELQTNATENTENILQIFEALLDESDAEEEDDETLVKQVLTTLESDTTAAYPTYEDTESQLNHTKREEYSSKHKAITAKKGEIYNGAVYKAPVYDAPTYNFIYTAPNHPVVPLTPGNNPFLNYPAMLPNYADPAANHYNPFAPMANQSNLGVPGEIVPAGNMPFNPLQFWSSLAAMSSNFGYPASNLMPGTQTAEYTGDVPATNNNQPETSNNPSGAGQNPSNSPVYNQILPQTHPSPQMFLPPPPQQVLSPLAPLSSIADQLTNSLPLLHQGQYQNNHQAYKNVDNSGDTDSNESQQPLYPFPMPPNPIYSHAFNPQIQPPQPLAPPMGGGFSFQPSSQPLALPYQQFAAPSAPLPFTTFNATLFNQIAETLKTITSRY